MTLVSAEALRRQIRSQHFAVLATTGTDGSADSAGVSYGAVLESGQLVLYVMTRRHLRKARDIARQPRVSLVIPIRRRLLWFMPPATVQLRGEAELLPQDDQRGTLAFQGFFLGRRILASYRAMRLRGDDRICFVRIKLDATARSYMVGVSLWQVIRRMEAGAATTDLRAGRAARTDASQGCPPGRSTRKISDIARPDERGVDWRAATQDPDSL